jgi:hypothetical protein
MQETEFRSYGTLFDGDGYYRKITERKTHVPVVIVLASSNQTRLRTLTTICESLGLMLRSKIFRGLKLKREPLP